MTKKKAVFNRNITRLLCKQGFKVVDVQPNNYKPWLNVYYFIETPEFLRSFDQILRDRK